MSAPALAVGVATYTRHDAHTRKRLADYRERLKNATDRELLAASLRAETLPGHGVADTIRRIVDGEVDRRRAERAEFGDWWTHAAAGAVL